MSPEVRVPGPCPQHLRVRLHLVTGPLRKAAVVGALIQHDVSTWEEGVRTLRETPSTENVLVKRRLPAGPGEKPRREGALRLENCKKTGFHCLRCGLWCLLRRQAPGAGAKPLLGIGWL